MLYFNATFRRLYPTVSVIVFHHKTVKVIQVIKSNPSTTMRIKPIAIKILISMSRVFW